MIIPFTPRAKDANATLDQELEDRERAKDLARMAETEILRLDLDREMDGVIAGPEDDVK